jgi:3-isopropylmalate dehydratase small subunit
LRREGSSVKPILSVISLGDDVSTDDIIAGKYLRADSTEFWRQHLFEDFDDTLRERIGASTMILAGYNFGCGSSREQAVLGLKATGLRVIVAKSFGAIFYRNCVNNGLLAATYDEADALGICDREEVMIDYSARTIRSLRTCACIAWKAPPLQFEIFAAGGLIEFYRSRRSRPKEA